MKKTIWLIFGFFLFLSGFLALVLSMVGVKLAFLTWIDLPSALFGFLFRILMIVSGIIIIYLVSTDWRAQE